MTPPPAVIQWLTANNMRVIPNDEYLQMMVENVTMKKPIERLKQYFGAVPAE